jgi:DNA repair protein RecN (Recombination protein N)
MLTSIQVRNFAIIDEVEIEFRGGMTVLTGETGAGKSILVDAMGLVLGERGGSGLVRVGARRAEFVADFNLADLPTAREWLAGQMLDLDDECNLRRVISADGRSRAFINGNSVPLQSLKALGELLLDIHGQHFHQSLGRNEVQRGLLDYYGGLVELAVQTRNAYEQWKAVAGKLSAIRAADSDRSSRLDLLRFEFAELEALALDTGEFEHLLQERSRLQNSTKLAEGVSTSIHNLFEAEQRNVQTLVADVVRRLEDLAGLDTDLEAPVAMLQEAAIQISEATEALQRYGEELDMDPGRYDAVEERLDAITSVARKHRIEPEEIAEFQARLAGELHDLEHAEERGEELEKAVAEAESRYRQAAGKLSEGRGQAAGRFSKDVTAAMEGLGMPGGQFQARVGKSSSDDPRAVGLDDIEFLISANPGQDLKPLSRVASGGELSRMSLAIQVIASDGSQIPTMVFDEVDSGVGGGVAEMVGLRLRELGQSRQVFCVTHLPQVASLGDNHFRIMKISDGKTTRTGIDHLSGNERVDEIARMLGGVEITERTRDHAAEMLERHSLPASKKAKA